MTPSEFTSKSAEERARIIAEAFKVDQWRRYEHQGENPPFVLMPNLSSLDELFKLARENDLFVSVNSDSRARCLLPGDETRNGSAHHSDSVTALQLALLRFMGGIE